MLQAASKMLDYKGSDAATDFKARVGCAKIIIDRSEERRVGKECRL